MTEQEAKRLVRASLDQLIDWAKEGYFISHLGIIIRVEPDRFAGFCHISYLNRHRSTLAPSYLENRDIFPIRNHLLFTITNITIASPFYHGADSFRMLGRCQFMDKEIATIAVSYQLPDETHHLIDLASSQFTVNQQLPIVEAPIFTIVESWLDRTGTINVSQFDDRQKALDEFEQQTDRYAGCSCGIWLRLLLDHQQSQVLGLALYCDTDQILP